jgi:DNA-directed RNA polymerase subunit RPC12/RpoP
MSSRSPSVVGGTVDPERAERIANATQVRCNSCKHEDEGAWFIPLDQEDDDYSASCPECGYADLTILA